LGASAFEVELACALDHRSPVILVTQPGDDSTAKMLEIAASLRLPRYRIRGPDFANRPAESQIIPRLSL